MPERLNIRFKRRTKNISALSSYQSSMGPVASIMIGINEEEITGRKYINMELN